MLNGLAMMMRCKRRKADIMFDRILDWFVPEAEIVAKNLAEFECCDTEDII